MATSGKAVFYGKSGNWFIKVMTYNALIHLLSGYKSGCCGCWHS